MKIESLQSLFVDELKDAYDFEHQLLEALPKMAAHAHDTELQNGFRQHLEQTKGHVDRLEKVFNEIGERPERRECEGMKGLIKEGEQVVKARGDDAACDAALISAAQRVEHYEMAAYGTLCAFADALGRANQSKLLGQILDQEKQTDEKLSKLAEARVNPRAIDGGSAGSRPGAEAAARSAKPH